MIESTRWAISETDREARRAEGKLGMASTESCARHDLLPTGYAFGAVQTTRGCPLNCSFCSVTAFNGAHYRRRPVPDGVREVQLTREKRVLVVDDNLIGTRPGREGGPWSRIGVCFARTGGGSGPPPRTTREACHDG